MMALTLTEPWATLVAIGAKQWETRSWPARFRGQLAIHAAKGFRADDRWYAEQHPLFRAALEAAGIYSPFVNCGKVIAIATLTECLPTDRFVAVGSTGPDHPERRVITTQEFAFGNFEAGRFAFKLDNVLRLQRPIACKGALGFWSLPDAGIAQIHDELASRRSA